MGNMGAARIASASDTPPRVVGVDVGGNRKGFHAVLLEGDEVTCTLQNSNPRQIANWCREMRADVVAIDAPCRWSVTGRARTAERELAQLGIHTFATPSRERAVKIAFHSWMLNGECLYECLAPEYPKYGGEASGGRVSIETFPQAVACALAGRIVSAKAKATLRRGLLAELRIDTSKLSNIDLVDAALCAIAGQRFLAGTACLFGDAKEGHIVVPRGIPQHLKREKRPPPSGS